jgi:hypothetical protein
MQPLRLLLVEDSDRDAELLVRKLRQGDFEPETTRVDNPDSLRAALEASPWDVIICDYELPTMDAPEAVAIIRGTELDVPIIVVSGKVGEESAVAVMRAGAQDYLTKDRLFRLGEVVRRELAEVAIRRQRVEAERAFLASEDRLRFALEAARMGVWDWDIGTDKMHWAPSAPQLWVEGGLRGTFADCLLAVYLDDREMVARAYAEALNGRRPLYAVEHRIVVRDGQVRWVDVRGRVFFDGAGQATRMAGTFLDITQQRALEQQLAHGEKMKTIGQLAGGVAHDFNNLLTVILTYTQLLEMAHAGDPEVTEMTSPVRDAAERAAALTRQLLVFSRPEAVAPRVLDLNEVIRTVTKLLVRLVGEHVRLETDLADNMWRVRMDRSQCEQVVLNLAVNARDAMPQGGMLQIATHNVPRGPVGGPTSSDGDRVVLEVTDSGEGMSAEVQAKIFQPFFTTKAQGRGTGLGLATCHTVVTHAGGSIDVQSVPGDGTTFRVYLPRCEDEADLVPRRDRVVPAASASERILVVEDDSLVRNTAARALRIAGYEVVVAADGEEALHLLLQERSDPLDLLLTDIVMPRMGGIELTNAVKIRNPGMKILFMSGYPVDSATEQGLAKGTPLLVKPFTADELTSRVREALDARATTRGG